MKILLVKSVGQLYMELIAHLEKNKEVPVTLQFDTVYMSDSEMLGLHDTIDIFSGKLDISIEVLYDMPVFFGAVLASVPVEKRKCMPSTIIHFVRQQQYAQGTATDMVITGEQVIRTEDRLTGLISATTHMESADIKQRCDRHEFIDAKMAIEKGFFGGFIYG